MWHCRDGRLDARRLARARAERRPRARPRRDRHRRTRRYAGAEATLASAVIRGKMGELYGYTDFAVPKDEFREQYLHLVGHAAADEIVFDIEAYPLARVAEAWERQADGANAKIVVTLT